MLISHFNLFLSFLTLIIFISRVRNQRLYESLLTLFAFVNFLTSLVWILFLYYNCFSAVFIDNFGVLSELVALSIPIFILIDIRFDRHSKRFIIESILIGIITIVAVVSQYLITNSKELYLFLPDNPNYFSNILFQLAVDLLILVAFLRLFLMKQNKNQLELFDGQFKKYFGLVFFTYYFQDMLVLTLMLTTHLENKFIDALQDLSMLMSLIVSMILGIMGISTNYLPLWNQINWANHKHDKPFFKSAPSKTFVFNTTEWSNLSPINWNKVKLQFIDQYPSIVKQIDENTALSKTEKSYAFIQHFDLSHKEIADLMCVSIRTVETYYYRIKQKKLKK